MARFLKHIGCDRCGSSDAKAVYDDGSSFCFSCRKPTSSKVSGYVSKVLEQETPSLSESKVSLPSDATTNYSKEAVDWCAKYDITVEQMLQNGMVFSAHRSQLLFTWYDENKELLAYQARNLNPVSKSKRYFTCGDVNELLPIYHCRYPLPDGVNSRRLVLVEDCLSAIKVSYTNMSDATSEKPSGCDSMPLLGSGISRTKLSRLKHLYGALNVFLDPDMWHKSLNIVKQAQLLGFQARPIQSDRDPKEHDYSQLKELLK